MWLDTRGHCFGGLNDLRGESPKKEIDKAEGWLKASGGLQEPSLRTG